MQKHQEKFFELNSVCESEQPGPPSQAEYSWDSRGHVLRFRIDSSSKDVKNEFKTGVWEFALEERASSCLLFFRPGSDLWYKAAYNVNRMSLRFPMDLVLPDKVGDSEALLVLVDSNSSTILARREITWPAEFSRALHAEMLRQDGLKWDERKYQRENPVMRNAFTPGPRNPVASCRVE